MTLIRTIVGSRQSCARTVVNAHAVLCESKGTGATHRIRVGYNEPCCALSPPSLQLSFGCHQYLLDPMPTPISFWSLPAADGATKFLDPQPPDTIVIDDWRLLHSGSCNIYISPESTLDIPPPNQVCDIFGA